MAQKKHIIFDRVHLIVRMKMLLRYILAITLFTNCSEEAPVKSPSEELPPENGSLRKIVFNAKDEQGHYKLFTINEDGSRLKAIFSPTAQIGDLWVSPLGDRMVCCVNIATPPYANYQLFLVYVDGREAKQLTYDPPGIAEEPQWFPNGEEILYGFQGPWRGAQIFRIRIDGSNSIRITTDDTTSHRFPRLSPDGQKIAFETRGHPNKIWVMNVNGSNKILLSTPGTDAASPEWAPDAIRVVYRTYGNEAGLWSVNADGSNSQKLCNGIGTHHVSRISGKIVFGTYQGIYTINPDGSGFAQLTNVYVDGYPILWSRDGTKIAFRGDANGDHKKGICTIDDDGKNLKEIIDPSLEIVQSPYNRTFDWIP